MTDQFNSVSSLEIDALGVPVSHIGLMWSYCEDPAPGDLVWADHTRLARLVLVDGVLHLLLVDGAWAPAEGRVARKVTALLLDEPDGYPGNMLVPAPWDQGGARHGC